MTSQLIVNYKGSINGFDPTFPILLKEKGVSQEDYFETVKYLNAKTARILSHSSHLIPTLIWILALVIFMSSFSAAILANILYNKTSSFGFFSICLPILMFVGVVLMVILFVFMRKKTIQKTLREFEVLKKELEAECAIKYNPKGVDIYYGLKDHKIYGKQTKEFTFLPYLEIYEYIEPEEEVNVETYEPSEGLY